MQIQFLHHLADIADNLGAEQRTRQPAAVAEETGSLSSDVLPADVAQQTDQPAVQTGAVHVPAHSRHLDTRLHSLLESLLAQGHEGLLHGLVGQ